MIQVYNLVIRSDAFVVTQRAVLPIFIKSMDGRTLEDVFCEFEQFLLARGEIILKPGRVDVLAEKYASFIIRTKKIGSISN